jgi:ketosteroid isomerase-like protein
MASTGIAEHKQLVNRLYEAFNRGDIEETMAQLHPEIEVRLAIDPMEPVAGSRHELSGEDDLRQFWELLYDSWESVTVEIKEFVEGAGDRLISFETWTVRGPQGIELDTGLVDVYGFRDGLIASCDGFRDKNDALAEFGPGD